MYKTVFFEISGKCNAICRWCTTGLANLKGENRPSRFIPTNKFDAAIDYLLENNIVDNSTIIHLYNWGEPLLHPQFHEIVDGLNQRCIKFGLSTNASVAISAQCKDEFRNLAWLRYSIPGFSQASYDKIHGFNFEEIKQNIKILQKEFTSAGYKGKPEVSFLVYQFNMNELQNAFTFFEPLGIKVFASYAYFNGFRMFQSYLDGTMPCEDTKKAKEELVLDFIEARKKERPTDYYCPQYSMLTIDEYCEVLTCCSVEKGMEGYSIGNLFELDFEQIHNNKLSQAVCATCESLKLDYIGHNPFVLHAR